jgi:hypothetical protein
LFRRENEALPGKQGCAGGQPPTIFQDNDDIKKNITNEFMYRGADKSLAQPGRKQATATEDSDVHISYL